MADERITLHFGAENSTADVFREVNAEIKDFQKGSKDAFKGVGDFAHAAAGKIGGELGDALNGVTTLARGLAQGGLWGAAAAAAGAAVSAMIGWWKDYNAKIDEAHQKIVDMAAAHQRFIQELEVAQDAQRQNVLDATADKALAAVRAVESLSAALKGLAAAEDAATGSGVNLQIAKINSEFAERLNEACNELKPVITAERDLAVAMERQKAATDSQKVAVERAEVALNEVKEEIELQKKAIAAVQKAGYSAADEYEKLNQLKIKEQEASLRLKAAQDNAEASLITHQSAVDQATAALQRANESWEKVVEANEKELDATGDMIEAKAKLKDLLTEQAKVEDETKSALAVNDVATQRAKDALQEARDMPDKIAKGIAADNKTHEWLPHNWKYGQDGKLANPSDVGRAMRAYERQEQKEAASRERKMDNLKEKADRAAAKKEKDRNWADKKAIKDYEDAKKYYEGEDDAEGELKRLAEERKQILKDSRDHLEDIKKKIEKLGIK